MGQELALAPDPRFQTLWDPGHEPHWMNERADQPQFIAHYRVARPLGAGGMGEVYLAEDTKLDRSVALKVLPKNMAEDASRRKRFLAEAKAASALNHPSVCTIYEVGETVDGQPFIAMEYLEGLTLDALARRRRLELREIVSIGLQVAEALEAAWENRVVHRDIKPGNIMVDAQQRVKVLDFGLAKRLDRPIEASTLTQEGALLGTPNYLSPELALGREVDCRTDIFSLGVLLYELAAGRNPFAGASFGETVNNIVNRDPPPLRPWNPNVMPEFERVVRKCLEKEPSRRHTTPGQLAIDLRKLKVVQEPSDLRQAKLVWMVTAVGVTACLLALVGWPFLRPHTIPEQGQASVAAQKNRSSGGLSRQRLVLLPLKSVATGEANEIFTDGLAVELFSKLSHIRGLQVIDGSTFVKSQSLQKDFTPKWRELNAGALLQGTVLKEQKLLRIRLQLLDSQTQEVLKSFDFDREPESVLALQTEAAEVIAVALEVQLLAEDRVQLARKPTDNPRAYQAYLQGRAFWGRFTDAGWRRSIDLFQEAIRLDPQFALAYAGLADSYVQLSIDFLSPTEGFGIAKTNALRALELQPSLAQAYVSLAECKMWFDRDYPGAKEAFETALRLEPRYPDTYHFMAHYYEILGEVPRALECLQKAIEYDPLMPILQAELGWAYYHARRYGDGAAQSRKLLASDPTFDYAGSVLGMNLLLAGEYEEAIPNLEQAWKSLRWPIALGQLGYAYGVAGKPRQAREVLNQLHTLESKKTWLTPSAIGIAHLGLGETNEALAEFERAVDAHDGYMAWANVEPQFDGIRNEPRFHVILRRLNLASAPKPSIDASATAPQKSVAVLPFSNRSPEPGDEYLSDGITDELITSLQKVGGLRVQGRGSSFQFKGTRETLGRICEQLQVGYLVEGSITKVGKTLRVTADLVDATGFQLWGTNYDRALDDLLAIRTEVATCVAEALRGHLLGEEKQALGKRQTQNAEAYRLYLLGSELWNRRTGQSLRKAIVTLEEAIRRDSNFAEAYASLADCYVIAPEYLGAATHVAYPKAEAAARQALRLNPELAEPHAVLGVIRGTHHWDWDGGEVEFKKAIELDPYCATAHHWYAMLLNVNLRHAEALVEIERARRIDPLSPIINTYLTKAIRLAGDQDKAISLLREQLRSDPRFLAARDELGLIYIAAEEWSKAIAEFEIERADPGLVGSSYGLGFLGFTYARAGRTNEAMEIIGKIRALEPQCETSLEMAYVQCGLGNEDQTFEWLETAQRNHASGLEWLNVDEATIWKELRPNPRFRALLKKMNLVMKLDSKPNNEP